MLQSDLRKVMEARFQASRKAILAEIKRRLASKSLTIAELVDLTIAQSYWRGAVDATETEPSKATLEVEKTVQDAS